VCKKKIAYADSTRGLATWLPPEITMGRHVLGAAALAFICGVLVGCGKTQQPAKPPPDPKLMQNQQRQMMEKMKNQAQEKETAKDKDDKGDKGDKK
jgi:hypothetical protein